MEPVSAISGLLSLADITLRATSAIIRLANDTKHASGEKKLLVEEAKALQYTLERLKLSALESSTDTAWLQQQATVVAQFQAALEDLAKVLKLNLPAAQVADENRFKTALAAVKWSFSKPEVYAVLERLTRLQRHANTLFLEQQSMMTRRLADTQKQVVDKWEVDQIINWISPLHMLRVHRAILERAEPQSGRWFLDGAEFQSWISGSQKKLWCSGMPGAGKTVLTSLAVDHAQKWRSSDPGRANFAVVVLYLRYNDLKQTFYNLLASCTQQLIQEQAKVPLVVHEMYRRHYRHDTIPCLEEMTAALTELLTARARSLIFVDGLDECSEDIRWALIETLKSIGPNVSLFFTSRLLEAIGEELGDFQHAEISAHQEDIELYVERQIRENKHLRKMAQRSPRIVGEIKAAVGRTADKMFLLATLHIQSLSAAAALSVRRVRQKLGTLPNTLDDSYAAAMQRIQDQDPEYRSVAWKAVGWLAYAYRSVSVAELQHALVVEAGDCKLDEDAMMDGQTITSLCAGLLVIDQSSRTVNLVHYTTKRYLEKRRSTLFPDFHATITLTCATYLTFEDLRHATLLDIVKHYPLACYAAQYIGDHARESPEDTLEPSVLAVICDLLSNPEKRKPLLSLLDSLDLVKTGFYSYSNLELETEADLTALNDHQAEQEIESRHAPAEQSTSSDATSETVLSEALSELSLANKDVPTLKWNVQPRQSRLPEVTALHLAASMGLAKIASMLLKRSGNIDAVDDSGNTALSIATEKGMQNAVELLIENGASVALDTLHGQAVLLLAAERNWSTVALTILRKAESSGLYADHLHDLLLCLRSAYDGDAVLLAQIWPKFAVEASKYRTYTGRTVLFLAVEQGHTLLIDYMQALQIDISARDASGRTALHRATKRRDMDMMAKLLSAGVAVDAKNDEGFTAFTAYSKLQDERVAHLLLSAGADPNARAANGANELYSAAAAGDLGFVDFLLKMGTDPSIKTDFDWAPLHWAARWGHEDCVRSLIKAGADVSCLSDQKVTPLDLAMEGNELEIISLLLSAGARRAVELHSEGSDSQSGEGAAASDLPPSGGEQHSNRSRKEYDLPNDAEHSCTEKDEKSSLCFDSPLHPGQEMDFGQFIFQSDPVAVRQVYFVSHCLSTERKSIELRSASDWAKNAEYPMITTGGWPDRITLGAVMFTLTATRVDLREITVSGGPAKPDFLPVSMAKGWSGEWKIYQRSAGEDHMIMKIVPDWTQGDADGKEWTRFITADRFTLARSRWDRRFPALNLETGLDTEFQNLIVACWTAKLWAEIVSAKRDGTLDTERKSRKE